MSPIDILIFCGQSNMQGQTERLSEQAPVKSAWEYRLLSDTLIPLQNPVGEDIRRDGTAGMRFTDGVDLLTWLDTHILGSACESFTNLVPEFCRAYIANAHTPVIAVHAAKGSTKIQQWLPETDGYQMLLKKVHAAIEKAKEAHRSRVFDLAARRKRCVRRR